MLRAPEGEKGRKRPKQAQKPPLAGAEGPDTGGDRPGGGHPRRNKDGDGRTTFQSWARGWAASSLVPCHTGRLRSSSTGDHGFWQAPAPGLRCGAPGWVPGTCCISSMQRPIPATGIRSSCPPGTRSRPRSSMKSRS